MYTQFYSKSCGHSQLIGVCEFTSQTKTKQKKTKKKKTKKKTRYNEQIYDGRIKIVRFTVEFSVKCIYPLEFSVMVYMYFCEGTLFIEEHTVCLRPWAETLHRFWLGHGNESIVDPQ